MNINNLPTVYYCTPCGARKVKLWRNQKEKATLFCMACAIKNQGINKHVNKDGVIKKRGKEDTYRIAALYPAILKDSNTLYGEKDPITEQSETDFAQWELLPTRPVNKKKVTKEEREAKFNQAQEKLQQEIERQEKLLAKEEKRKTLFNPIIKESENGATIINFRDKLGQKCVIRTSSKEYNCLLIGVDSTHLTKLIKAEVVEGQVRTSTPQMILNVEDIEKLIPVLINWVATGYLEL